MKRILSMLLLSLVLLAIHPLLAFAQKPVSVLINGSAFESDVPPIIQNNRTLVPLQAIAEAMNIDISWDEQTGIANAADGDTSVRLQINNATGYRNNTPTTLDVSPQNINGSFMIPLRFFAESFNYQVDWNSELYQVSLLSPVTATDIPSTEVIPIIPPVGSSLLLPGISQCKSLEPRFIPLGAPPLLPVTVQGEYVGDINSDTYHHYDYCLDAQKIKWSHLIWFKSEKDAKAAGYVPCGHCCGN